MDDVLRSAVALGDLDGDGDLDAVLVGLGTDHIYLNEERGARWTERVLGSREPGEAPRTTSVAIGDVDGDRDLDIVVPGRYEARSVIYINDGKAGFAEARAFGSTRDDTTSVAVSDLDGDGDLDIVAANWEQPPAIHLNDGRGRFTHGSSFGDGRERTWSVALADLDLDGDTDVVLGNANIGYWRTDLDADGRPDRFGNERRDNPSRVYLNDGKGRITGGTTFGFGNDDTRPIALGDVDGDGDPDIVMGNDCQPNHVFFNPLRGPKAITLP